MCHIHSCQASHTPPLSVLKRWHGRLGVSRYSEKQELKIETLSTTATKAAASLDRPDTPSIEIFIVTTPKTPRHPLASAPRCIRANKSTPTNFSVTNASDSESTTTAIWFSVLPPPPRHHRATLLPLLLHGKPFPPRSSNKTNGHFQ